MVTTELLFQLRVPLTVSPALLEVEVESELPSTLRVAAEGTLNPVPEEVETEKLLPLLMVNVLPAAIDPPVPCVTRLAVPEVTFTWLMMAPVTVIVAAPEVHVTLPVVPLMVRLAMVTLESPVKLILLVPALITISSEAPGAPEGLQLAAVPHPPPEAPPTQVFIAPDKLVKLSSRRREKRESLAQGKRSVFIAERLGQDKENLHHLTVMGAEESFPLT